MTTAIANSPSPRLQRANTAPTPSTGPKPELQRSNTAPLPGAGAKPELQKSPTAPAATSPARPGEASTPAQGKVQDSFSKAGTADKGWHGKAVAQATADAQASGTGMLGRLKAGAGLAGGVNGIVSNSVGLANAIKNGEGGQAIAENALGLTRGVVGTAKGALDTAAAVESTLAFRKVGQAAKDAIGSQGKLSGAIANAAAEAVHNGKNLRDVDVLASIAKSQGTWGMIKNTTQMTVAEKLRDAGFKGAAGKIESKVADAGRKAAEAAGGVADAAKGAKVADTAIDAAKGAEAALKVGAKGAGTAARLAGRFAPGLNIAMAGVDTAIAARTLSDPNASVASKVTSSITAAGSIAAATNIPIVSQVGAGISAVSSIAGVAIENAGKIKDGFKKLGDKIKSFF
jgi:hypothetical protein